MGSLSIAAVAAPPSPAYPRVPLPATVWIRPVEATTSRIRLLPESAMNRSPAESSAMAVIPLNCAFLAGPPSPPLPAAPVPAKVMMLPVAATTSRITLFPASAMKRSPAASTATAEGSSARRRWACPPSPV